MVMVFGPTAKASGPDGLPDVTEMGVPPAVFPGFTDAVIDWYVGSAVGVTVMEFVPNGTVVV